MNDPVNHSAREPNQPSAATIVEGEYVDGHVDDLKLTIPYAIRLDRLAPGNVEFTLTINGKLCGKLPFDNLVKAATRIDPDHAIGPEQQIQKLRREVAEARAEKYDWQAKAEQFEAKIRTYEESTKA